MVSISPGNSPQFRTTAVPAGVSTSIDQIGWAVESDDGNSNVTIASNPDDPSGLTTIVTIPPEITVGAILTYWCVYRNPDQTEVTGGPWNLTIVA